MDWNSFTISLEYPVARCTTALKTRPSRMHITRFHVVIRLDNVSWESKIILKKTKSRLMAVAKNPNYKIVFEN